MDPDESATAPFLKLPGELRNRIYRLHLATEPQGHGYIVVDLEDSTEPPLLITCHQVRREALPLYYCESSFYLTVGSYNSALPLRWAQQLARLEKLYNISHVLTTVHPDMYAHWPNLMLWFQRIHSGELCWVPTVPLDDDAPPEFPMVGLMFCQIGKLRGLSWPQAESVVQGFRQLLDITYDGQWGEDTPLGEENQHSQLR